MVAASIRSAVLIPERKVRSIFRLRLVRAPSLLRKFLYAIIWVGILYVTYWVLYPPRTTPPHVNRLHDTLAAATTTAPARPTDAPHALASTERGPSDAFVIDTPGCRIPNMAPRSPEVEKFLYDYESLNCGDPPPLVESNDTALFIARDALAAYNITKPAEISCCYTAMWRFAPNISVPEWKAGMKYSDLGRDLSDGKLYSNDIRYANECVPFEDSALMKHEFVHVQCTKGGKQLYEDYHAFVPLKEPKEPPSAGEDVHWSEKSLNVLVVGVDAVARLNFLRTMPRTEQLLRETLRATGMLGYNKVEDNTFPNVLPLLSGLSLRDIERGCWQKKDAHFDACPWVWRRFNQRGYVTAFAEDTAWMGLFQHLKKNFINQPTDYDARPVMYVGEKRLERGGRGLNFRPCIGQRFQIEMLFEYAGKFLRKMQAHGRKFFGYFWGTSLSHDYLNQADEADGLYSQFLTELMEMGVLNHTALVFMSDHGMRYGDILTTYQGHLEERLPFMYLVLPEWFRVRYAVAMDTLRHNSRRLITTFDLHRTLDHFMDVRALEPRELERAAAEVRAAQEAGKPHRGISLFVPIPDGRTCSQADIPTHYCACEHLHRVSSTDPAVLQVVDFVVRHVNSLLATHPQCEPLALEEVLDAWRGEPEGGASARLLRHHEYQVKLYTRPGHALLSATARRDLRTGRTQLAGTITRLNLYGQQSWCVDSTMLKLYCYCKQPPPATTTASGAAP